MISSMEDIQLNDSTNSGSRQLTIDDDERTSGLSAPDDKCSIEILMLIFYGG